MNKQEIEKDIEILKYYEAQPYGDNGPDDFTDCIQCHKVWLLEEAVD